MAKSNGHDDVSKKLDTLSNNIKRWQDISQTLDICDKKIEIKPRFISEHYIEKDMLTTAIDDGGIIHKNSPTIMTGVATTGMIGTESKGYCVGHCSVENFPRNPEHIKRALDISMDSTVKYALRGYLEELSEGIMIKNGKNFCRLSQDEVLCMIEPIKEQRPIDKKDLKELLIMSKDLMGHKYIWNTHITIVNALDKHYFSDSEGRSIFNTTQREMMCIIANFNHESGSKKTYVKNVFNPDYKNFNRLLNSLFDDIVTYVNQESTAPPIESGQYAVILGPAASGTTFHEGLGGHLLSGEYICTGESTVFKNKIGEKIIPLDITIIDNPLDKKAHGYYTFDEEGIPAKKTVLIENGILRNYLLNRRSAAYMGTVSNGHARSGWVTGTDDLGVYSPILPEPRTSNMEISSPHAVSNKELEKMLIEHCKKEGVAFGLYVDAGAGAVNVGTSEFNIFPHSMWKLYTDGRKERVTDGIIVGNAYELLKQIQGIGNKPEIGLGTCGSTSGGVPVQESAPAIFLPKVTVTEIDQVKYTKKLLD